MSHDPRWKSISHAAAWAAAALLLATVSPARAQDSQASSRPSSLEVMKSMSNTLQAAKRLSFHVESNFDDVLDTGQKLQFAGAATIEIRRPDGLFIHYRDDFGARKVWYDGKTLTLFDPHADVYAKAPAPPELEAAVDQFERDYGVFLPLSEIIIGNPYEKTRKLAFSGMYVGVGDVDGTLCHHVAFVGEQRDWQIWVEMGDTALPRKVVVTDKRTPSSPQYVANLMDWKLDAKLMNSDFEAKVPKGAVATTFLAIPKVGR